MYRLTVDKFLDHAAKWHANREVVCVDRTGARQRTTYAALRERSNRLSGSLLRLGLESGTTGPPKGVVYTHRSNYLHTMRALQADAFGLTSADTVLVAVPMFHANGWGIPFAAPAAGAKLVLPGRNADGRSLATLMFEESVVKSGGEWINPVEMEEIVGRLPEIALVAVIGVPHPRWGERPVLVFESRKDRTIEPERVLQALRAAYANAAGDRN